MSDLCYQLGAAVSFDGGATFSRNLVHGDLTCAEDPRNESTALHYSRSLGLGRLGILFLSSARGKWPTGGDTHGLAAHADGSFAAVWSKSVNGVQQLWFTRFRADTSAWGRSQIVVRQNDTIHHRTLRAGDRPTFTRSFPADSGAAAGTAPEQRNLNSRVALVIERASWDRATRTATLVGRIENQSAAPIVGPLVLTMAPETARYGAIQSLGADNGVTGVGASWTFDVDTPGKVLQPRGRSATRVLTWRVPESGWALFDITQHR